MAANAATWVLYTGLAFFMLFLMNYTNSFFDAILVRFAAILFVSAGFVGAAGFIGNTLSTIFLTVNSTGDQVARSAVGSAIMYLVWAGFGLLWVLCFLPRRWFSMDIPDWLSVLGLVLPAGLATVPGAAGNALTGIMHTLSALVTAPLHALFGV